MNEFLRQIPPIHELQNHQEITQLQKRFHLSNKKITEMIQKVVTNIRQDIIKQREQFDKKTLQLENIVSKVKLDLLNWEKDNLQRVINATGTILHTNFGRARLSDSAIDHVIQTAKNYSNLEFNISTGKRGSRHDIVEEIVKELTGAEAAIVVNNNAAAVYMVLRTFAIAKEVIVSRGELVEIGGSFRVSAIMEESDASLVEVGTTNKTHLFDYANAISDQTAMIMKVHTSNFKVVGFTSSVDRKELISLANEKKVLFYEDLGSGALYNFSSHKIGDEPVVRTVLNEGADLVSFSGDKLLGGPQVGIIAGKKVLIDKLKKHQLARVLRVDKMTLAALESTLKEYAKGSSDALQSIPTARDILKPLTEIKEAAQSFIEDTNKLHYFTFELNKDFSMIGGGTMPEVKLETYGVIITAKNISSLALERKLRLGQPPIIGRFVNEKFFLDFRTLTNTEIKEIVERFMILDNELHVV
jgi:L-seryl-tRNA(Ser) seleniumtransferase